MILDRHRYYKLLKYSQKLDSEGKSLYNVSELKFDELLRYRSNTLKKLDLGLLNYYINLLEEFLENKMNAGELFSKYLKLQDWQSEIKNNLEANLIILVSLEKEFPIDDILYNLYWILEERININDDQFFEAVVKEENFEIAIESIKSRDLYNSINKIYKQLQDIASNYRSNHNISDNFKQLLDQLSWENQIQYTELIEQYLDNSISFLNFIERYQSMVKVAKKLESNSIALKLDYQALGFSNYIKILIELFENYQINKKIGEEVFKTWVREILFEIKTHY